jgi:hypothetical protein
MQHACASFLWWGTCALLMGCSGTASRVLPIAIDPSTASSTAIELYDKDGDGAISGKELDDVPGIKKYLDRYDRDGDGKVIRAEIADRLEDWSNQRLALSGASLAVKLDGEWLEGATVTFVPESYLGPNVKPAYGTTMQNGFASVSHAEEDLPKSSSGRSIPGVFSGTYKIQITHPNRNIPARYNTATQLGEEIAYDINPTGTTIPISLSSK